MKTVMIRLWTEECGALIAAEMLLIMSILVIGVIVGLAAVRDSIVTELADVAQAIANVNQSFSFSGVSGHHAYSGGGAFHDSADFCDRGYERRLGQLEVHQDLLEPGHSGMCRHRRRRPWRRPRRLLSSAGATAGLNRRLHPCSKLYNSISAARGRGFLSLHPRPRAFFVDFARCEDRACAGQNPW